MENTANSTKRSYFWNCQAKRKIEYSNFLLRESWGLFILHRVLRIKSNYACAAAVRKRPIILKICGKTAPYYALTLFQYFDNKSFIQISIRIDVEYLNIYFILNIQKVSRNNCYYVMDHIFSFTRKYVYLRHLWNGLRHILS